MKNFIVKLCVSMMLAAVICYVSTSGVFSVFCSNSNRLVLDNIEALAADEGVNFICFNDGDIDCYGEKVEFKVEGLSSDY